VYIHYIIMSQFDETLRTNYYEGREQAYNDNFNLFFIYILNELIEKSPNNIRHINNIMKIKTIYYTDNFRDIYEDKNLDLQFGTNRTIKSKEMIILELYFI